MPLLTASRQGSAVHKDDVFALPLSLRAVVAHAPAYMWWIVQRLAGLPPGSSSRCYTCPGQGGHVQQA